MQDFFTLAHFQGKHVVDLGPGQCDFLDIAIGLGTRLTFSCHDDTWLVNGSSIDGFGDVFMNANLFYRAAATFNVGFFGIGLAASIPTEGSFRHFDAMPSWEETRISASVLVNFF